MSFAALVNPAGGIRYHLRARRYAERLWHPFRWALGEWLLGWRPPERTLFLFGPSGGYNLQPFLFERFDQLVCFEPDPLAFALFARRLKRAPLERRPKLERIAEDHLVTHPERLAPRLESAGPAALLFSNLIGQLPMLTADAGLGDREFERTREAIVQALRGRSHASFHDRSSGEVRLDFAQPLIADSRLTDREVLDSIYNASDEPSLESLGLVDHNTTGFFPEAQPHAYFTWELEPGWFHLIEGVQSTKPE